MKMPPISESLQQHLALQNDHEIQNICHAMHPADLAAQFAEFSLEQSVDIISKLSPDCCCSGVGAHGL
jgi:flagellar motility protein MotE (MotC chaperone)